MGKYLKLYEKWSETGKLPRCGLCSSLGWKEDIDIFRPEEASCWDFWAADGYSIFKRKYGFGPTRKNILLLLACLNEEM